MPPKVEIKAGSGNFPVNQGEIKKGQDKYPAPL